MSMSKKDFIALADAIRSNNSCAAQTSLYKPFTPTQLSVLAVFCGEQNRRFNRERWLDYIAGKCGPNGGAIK